MHYFPINLDIRGRQAVIVGGGGVAARKCAALRTCGAIITVIAPLLDRSLQEIQGTGAIVHLERGYKQGDLSGAFLACAATDDPAVNRAVAEEAKALGILADIADAPRTGSFTMPAVVRRGDLLIAVSTGGASPALARRIREQLEREFGPEYGTATALLGRLREKLLTETGIRAYNKKIFNELVDHDLPSLIKNNSVTEIDILLTNLFGPEFTLAALGAEEKDPA
jgi:precorrin-2 dehydrogenase/sirohydrochlorin ferrochelatase